MKVYTADQSREVYKEAYRKLYEFLEQANGTVPITHQLGLPPVTMYKFQFSINNSSYNITVYSTGLIAIGNNLSFNLYGHEVVDNTTFDLNGDSVELGLFKLCEKIHDEDQKRRTEFDEFLKIKKLTEVFGIELNDE